VLPVDFRRRRERVRALLGESALVLFAAPSQIRNNDVEHEWRQDSDFRYLTGFDEPDSVLVLRGGAEPTFALFVRPRDPEREVWDGPRAGEVGAREEYGADVAYPIGELGERLPELLSNLTGVHYRVGRQRGNDDVIFRALDGVRRLARRGVGCPHTLTDPGFVLHELRLRKDAAEIERMERAAAITGEGHREAMARVSPGMFEYEAEAVLRAAFRRAGSERHAYAPIVGSGPNATVLHYVKNDRRMQAGELLLIDAGCEYDYYASDVTRTFPVSGTFTSEQRAVYEVVLAAELAAIQAVRPSATLEEVHAVAVRVISEGLVTLGVLTDPVDKIVADELYKPWFMHKTSHWLGMDVHDVGLYHQGGKPRPLEEGMVTTVEPGLYFSASDERVPAGLRGIGVRIEDDVLTTAGEPRVLTAAIPKTVDAIEQACRG
jgi:Xaa-Pro aminopeptidase